VNAEQIVSEIKRYETEVAGILDHFSENREGIWIKRSDDPIFRQYVREIVELFDDVFGNNNYSVQIANEFNDGIHNFSRSPSYKSVENILSVIRAALTRLNRNPELLERKKVEENAQNQQAGQLDVLLPIFNRNQFDADLATFEASANEAAPLALVMLGRLYKRYHRYRSADTSAQSNNTSRLSKRRTRLSRLEPA
jgi:hypothetical protein